MRPSGQCRAGCPGRPIRVSRTRLRFKVSQLARPPLRGRARRRDRVAHRERSGRSGPVPLERRLPRPRTHATGRHALLTTPTPLVQAFVVDDAEPVTDWAAGDTQQVGPLFPCASFVDPQQGGQTLEAAAVAGLPPPLLDLLALLGTQRDGLPRSPPDHGTRSQLSPCLGSTRIHCYSRRADDRTSRTPG
jgi:hypothetical protein